MGRESYGGQVLKDLQRIRAIRVHKRWTHILELSKRLGVSKATVCNWLAILKKDPGRFDPDGCLRRKPRADAGETKYESMIPKIHSLLKDPDRTNKSIAKELKVPPRLVGRIARGSVPRGDA